MCRSMRRHLVRHARIDAGRPTPHFDKIVAGSQILRAPNRCMVADMGAGIDVRRLDVLADNTDFVNVHGKLIQIDRFPIPFGNRAVRSRPTGKYASHPYLQEPRPLRISQSRHWTVCNRCVSTNPKSEYRGGPTIHDDAQRMRPDERSVRVDLTRHTGDFRDGGNVSAAIWRCNRSLGRRLAVLQKQNLASSLRTEARYG